MSVLVMCYYPTMPRSATGGWSDYQARAQSTADLANWSSYPVIPGTRPSQHNTPADPSLSANSHHESAWPTLVDSHILVFPVRTLDRILNGTCEYLLQLLNVSGPCYIALLKHWRSHTCKHCDWIEMLYFVQCIWIVARIIWRQDWQHTYERTQKESS